MMNSDKKTIILTGATGSFGRFLALELLKYNDVSLILLVRGASQQEAATRVKEIIDTQPGRVEVFRADLTQENLGLSGPEYGKLAKKATHILHSAASTRFNLPLEEARLHNVETTKKIIDLAKTCPNLVRFGFVSTALVAGRRSGVIMEDEFEHSAGFNNSYQQAKYEAEALVRSAANKLPVVIFRPPLIVSASLTSPTVDKKSPNFLYILISLIAQERLMCVPGTEKSTMDLVNSTDAARVIIQLLLKKDLAHVTYHITNGAEALTVGSLHKMVEEKFGKKIPVEYCGSTETFWKRIDQISAHNHEIRVMCKKAESFLLEPAYPKIFDNRNTLTELNIVQLGEQPISTLSLIFKEKKWSLSE
jgi:thioester reductase-like protein